MQPVKLVAALGLEDRRYVYVVGGGGKTTLIRALAAELAAAGHAVISTTSTRIRRPEGRVVLGTDLGEVGPGVVTVAAAALPGDKLAGLPLSTLDQIYAEAGADWVLVEADGSAGRSLKAHAAHEPVVSERAELVVAVVGLDVLGKPATDEHVHRAELLRERQGLVEGAQIGVEEVCAALLDAEGPLRGVTAPVVVVMTKGTPEQCEAVAAGLRGLRCCPFVLD